MKIVKTLCAFLLSLFITISAFALDIENINSSVFNQKKDISGEIVFAGMVLKELAYDYGTDGVSIVCADPYIKLSVTKDAGIPKFVLATEDLTFVLYRGCTEGAALQIECVSNSTGGVITLPKKGYKIVSLLRSKIDFGYLDADHAEFIATVLNLIQSWPSNLPILYPTSDPYSDLNSQGRGVLKPRYKLVASNGKELEPPPAPCYSLCDHQGGYHEGHILYLGEVISYGRQEGWTENFDQWVGYRDGNHTFQNCFGRCGKGCAGDYIGRECYTQKCFNHDGCVEKHGYTAYNCNIMFKGCIYDAVCAPTCYSKSDDSGGDGDDDDPFYLPYP